MKIPVQNQATMTGQYDGEELILDSTIAETTLVDGVTATKIADKEVWAGGELTYTIVVDNTTELPYETPAFTDQLDAATTLVANSVTVNGATYAYTYAGNLLSMTLPTIPATGSATIVFKVRKA